MTSFEQAGEHGISHEVEEPLERGDLLKIQHEDSPILYIQLEQLGFVKPSNHLASLNL